MKTAFTTLACPAWSWDRIVNEAARLGYDGIELRGLEGELYLPKCPPFRPDAIEHTLRQLEDNRLEICCIDTSCAFHDPNRYEAAIEEGVASIDLAHTLNAPFIRVFGDAIPVGANKTAIINRVSAALELLGNYAADKGVQVLLETHGDFSASANVLAVLDRTSSPAVGVLWDVNNPYKHGRGESVEETFRQLGPFIKHTHLKDSFGRGKEEAIRLPGEGDLPLADCLSILKRNGYDGWLSFEWEKKWHPHIEEPEAALPVYIRFIQSLG
ncbi:sugar phosphate isomerase/epimerase [Paenibacillus sp. MWE-103]|uniref:Sugar phosphate isomerase/epimerase n=1 Tax=Paenibacillus artemisiicola TaxID=1172618 RepID=A0ABS3W5Y8_9BACL|nr:sugar phosphate isomerase/epimerase family protein [Paenibacillus artemisiicola]MBO7743703.1 sugar phosphate isomerase/epimerase [Paenibacillus artemisiicola]